MVVLESGRVGVLVMVLGDGEAALDVAWAIHQGTPPAQRGEFWPWADGDVRFRVTNDAVRVGSRMLAVLVHASGNAGWGASRRADVTIRVGGSASATEEAAPVVRADDHPRPFDAWKQAIKVALTSQRGRGAEAPVATPVDVAPFVLDEGERALQGRTIRDPLVALTRAAPGVRLAYCASYVDHQIRNGGFAQLFWNAVAAQQHELVIAGGDALETLGLEAAGDHLDRALIAFNPHLDLLMRCSSLGPSGFAEFRDASGLAALDAPYFELARELPARLDAFVRGNPEDFAGR